MGYDLTKFSYSELVKLYKAIHEEAIRREREHQEALLTEKEKERKKTKKREKALSNSEAIKREKKKEINKEKERGTLHVQNLHPLPNNKTRNYG